MFLPVALATHTSLFFLPPRSLIFIHPLHTSINSICPVIKENEKMSHDLYTSAAKFIPMSMQHLGSCSLELIII